MVTRSSAITLARSAVAPPPLRPVRVRPDRNRRTGPAEGVALVSGGERPRTAVAPLGHASVRYQTLGSGGPQHWPAVDQPHGAAHADGSPDGTTLLYFEQEGQTFATGQELARTFGFVFDGTQYASVRLDGGDPDVPLPIYDHPYAASLRPPASASAGFVRPSFFNRVYLVDFSDAASPIYEDLTSWIEQFEDPSGALYGTFGGTQADCSMWYVSVGGGPLPPDLVWPDPPAHDPVTPIEGAGPSLHDLDEFVEVHPPTYTVAGVVGGPLHKPGVFP